MCFYDNRDKKCLMKNWMTKCNRHKPSDPYRACWQTRLLLWWWCILSAFCWWWRLSWSRNSCPPKVQMVYFVKDLFLSRISRLFTCMTGISPALCTFIQNLLWRSWRTPKIDSRIAPTLNNKNECFLENSKHDLQGYLKTGIKTVHRCLGYLGSL